MVNKIQFIQLLSYTAVVPVEWIFSLNPETFYPDNDDDDESYVIEWQYGKQPKDGWQHFNARVLILILIKEIFSSVNSFFTLEPKVLFIPLKLYISQFK